MGGANGVMGPFATTLTFATPTPPYGVLVVSVRSPRDGAVLEVAATRVAFTLWARDDPRRSRITRSHR